MNWAEEIGKNLIKRIDASVGNNHTIVFNLSDGKTIQFDYHVEHKEEKLEEDMKRLWEEFRIKK